MKITNEWLLKKSACTEGRNWFNKYFPDGGDIESVLIMIVADEANGGWINWLMTKAEYTELSWLEGLTVGGSLDLRGCTFPDGFKLPDSVGGYLDLRGCTFPDGFKLPDSVGGYLYLRGCKNLPVIPDHLKNEIIHW